MFLSFDLFLLFVFYEIAIIPKYFLIAIWGSTRREYGAMKLALYSFVGSAMVLVGLIAAYVDGGGDDDGLDGTGAVSLPGAASRCGRFRWCLSGFAILAGMWPFHTWAPTGHVAAPTAASMLLAGVVMKLGAYGCLRVAMTLFPLGLDPWGFHVLGIGSWRDVFALLAVIGIVYGAMVALVQKDFKFVIGYSSVSHMGFVLLGLMTLNQIGMSGAVMQMFSHGIIAGLLFAVVGRMVYDRTHTRRTGGAGADESEQGDAVCGRDVCDRGHGVAWGCRGSAGLWRSCMILIGVWRRYPLLAVLRGAGDRGGRGVYIWRAMQKAFFGEARA